MDLQTAFYVLGIVFMSLMLLIMLALVIAVFKIKAKINEIHRKIDEKINMVSSIAHIGTDIVKATKKVMHQR